MSHTPIFPDLTSYGVLPHDVDLTLDELQRSPFVTGEGLGMKRWNKEKRAVLAHNLRYVVERLWEVGYAGEVGVNGSFARACLNPRDVDVYCILSEEDETVHPDRLDRLNALEGEALWVFDEEAQLMVKGFDHPISPLCAHYLVDLHFDAGQFSGFWGHEKQRLRIHEAFRHQSDTYEPKGVIRIVRPTAKVATASSSPLATEG